MSQVISFEDYLPSPRYDSVAWSSVGIEEGSANTGPWTLIDTIALVPPDPDPALPAYRNFTTDNASDDADLWYQLTFYDANGAFAQPTYPVQNTAEDRPIYASVSELALLLKVNASTRGSALRRALETASSEIDSEIGTADIDGTEIPYGSPPALVSQVCLERAVEHWKQEQTPFGIVGLGDLGSVYTARDSWDRHAHKLAVLKGSWGLA